MNSSLSAARTAALACLVSVSTSAFAGPGDTFYDFFPMDPNNTWVFEKTTDKVHHSAEKIWVSDTGYAGGGWYESTVDGLFNGATPIWDHNWYSWAWTNDADWNWSIVYDFDTYVGDEWNFRAGPCNSYDIRVISTSETVQTPAHNYDDVHSFGHDLTPDANVRCAVKPLTKTYFAEHTGPVRLETDNSESSLIFARVRGSVIAHTAEWEQRTDVQNGSEHSLLAPELDYTQPHPIVCITFPCPQQATEARFALVVENDTNADVSYQFASGQQIEIDIWSGQDLVARWSDSRVFTQAATSFTLEPGETEVLYATLPLVTTGGALLDGTFSAVAYIVDGGPKLTVNNITVTPYQ